MTGDGAVFQPGETLYSRNAKPLEFRLEDIAIQVSQIESKRVVHPERGAKGTVIGYSIHSLNDLYSTESAALRASIAKLEEKRCKLSQEIAQLDREIADLRRRLDGCGPNTNRQ